MPVVDKPPYRVPLMTEINALPWNGYNVVSTFSGCGGSCLGYRMAGYKVRWANEFVPAAQDSYRANAPESILDCRDIKTVQPEEILSVIGLQKGDIDLFDGSPPCQAFSTAGKRDKGWGEDKTYEHGAKQKNEDLFYEYIRLLRGLKPKVFVAENVSGLVKGTAKGYFLDILKQMKESGYRVTCRVLDAQWLGVPQARQRTIFVGVRDDLGLDPVHPKPLGYRYSVRDALPWIKTVRQSVFGGTDQRATGEHDPCPTICSSGAIGAGRGNQAWVETADVEIIVGNDAFESRWGKPDVPNPTVLSGGPNKQGGFVRSATEKRKFTIAELRRICGFPDDFILTGTYAQQWERLGNSVPPVMMSHIASTIRDQILARL